MKIDFGPDSIFREKLFVVVLALCAQGLEVSEGPWVTVAGCEKVSATTEYS